MAAKPTNVQRAILREKARADNRAMHAALTTTERLADARAFRGPPLSVFRRAPASPGTPTP